MVNQAHYIFIVLFCLVLVAVVFSPFFVVVFFVTCTLFAVPTAGSLTYLSSHETEDTFYIVCFIFILIVMVLSPDNCYQDTMKTTENRKKSLLCMPASFLKYYLAS